MNGQMKIVISVVSGLIVLWLAWTSQTTMTNCTDIAVLQSRFVEIRENIVEIKEVVKDIRHDQQRLERKELK